MERVNIFVQSDLIELDDLERHLPDDPDQPTQSLKEAVADFEETYIKAAIARNQGNISQAARELQLERSHLYKKIKKRQQT